MKRRIVRPQIVLSQRRRLVSAGLLLCLVVSLAGVVSVCSLHRGEETGAWWGDGQTPESEWTELELPPEADVPVSLTPSVVDSAGVDPGSDFVLKASVDIEESSLRDGLRVEPAVALKIEKGGEREFRLLPQQPLQEETLYRFHLNLPRTDGRPLIHSWAFQTTTLLRVVQTLPGPAATDVPLNTGIELTFSYEGAEDLPSFFEITPSTRGRFETHKRLSVFVPESLQPNTLYTVTVRKGLGISNSDLVLAGDFSFQFETGETGRTGETPSSRRVVFQRRTNESPSSEAPSLYMATKGDFSTISPPPVSFAVYQYPDLEPFAAAVREFEEMPVWAYRSREAYLADTDDLSLAMTFEGSLEPLSATGFDFFVRFPAPLPPGFYLVEAGYEGAKSQGWLQVTDIAVHATVSTGKTLVWVNDVSSQGPLSGAAVSLLDGTFLSTTDEQGVAFFDMPASLIEGKTGQYNDRIDATGDLVVSDASGRRILVPLGQVTTSERSGSFYIYSYVSESDLYWNYLYLDRPLYLPTDTIRFWGVLKKREGASAQQEVTIELGGGRTNGVEYYGFNNRQVPLATTTLSTSPLGTFSGELSFENAAPGYYYVQLKAGSQQIAAQYLQISSYTKPAYKIDVVPSRKAVVARDTVDFSIDVSFFEGSPVPNAVLVYSLQGGNPPLSGEVTTDERGHAVLSFITPYADSSYSYQTLEVRPKTAEEGEITGSAWINVLPSAFAIDAKGSYEEGTARIEGIVRNVDLSRFEGDRPTYYLGDESLGPPVPGREVMINVTEESYERIERGQTYDFIRKMVIPLYDYRPIETPLGRFAAVTDNNGAFSHSFPAAESKRYHVSITTRDVQGREARAEPWIQSYVGSMYDRPNASPHIKPADADWCADYYYGEQAGYDIGQQVELVMQYGTGAAPAGGANRYLFLQAQNGILDHEVQDSPLLSFPFPERYAPNVNVFGVWFTGRTYKAAPWGCSVRANPEPQRLQIEITPDRERYGPGDEATLRISAQDSGGRPVRAEVNLSAVDEAIFRLQPPYYDSANRYDILAGLYKPVGHGLIISYGSHQYPGGDQPGGRGGDGGLRRDFQDIALFQSVMTDERGQATVTFKLPDNLTSWRVLAQGVTGDLKVGNARLLLPVGLPFFVDVAMSSEYLTSDKPQIRLRAFGTELAPDAEVTFEVTCPALGLAEPVRAGGPAFQPVDVPLPELVEGEHELTIKAASGDLSDSMTRRFRVVRSRLLRAQTQSYELTPDLAIRGSTEGRTTVVFSDHNRGRYYPLLLRLTWTYGDRVDQMLARNLSQELLKQYFGEENAYPAAFEPSSYQTPQGGIALFPYADADLTLSARLAALAPDRFGRNSLAAYLAHVVDDRNETRERAIVALNGLAALGEPVLPQLAILAGEADLTWRERLYLGLASLAAGDEETARRIYRSLLEDFGERRLPYLRLRVGVDQDDILEATSLAAILGGGIGDELAPRLFDYTTGNYTKDILVQLEQISYLTGALPRLPAEPVRFAYRLDGKRQEAELKRGGSLTLSLTPRQLADLQPEPIEGHIGVTSFYLAPLDVEDAVTDADISISRRFELAAEPGNVYHDDSLVRIVIDWKLGPQALDGCYQVTDILPSGLKPITRDATWSDVAGERMGGIGPYQVDGQRVSFCVGKWPAQLPIVYYARVVSKGEYGAEPAIIQSMRAPDSFNLTPSDHVRIR